MFTQLRLGRFAFLISCLLCTIGLQVYADGGRLRAVLAGTEVPSARLRSLSVDSDMTGVDEATIVLETGRGRAPAVGDALRLDAEGGGDTATTVFTGEVVGIEPALDARGGSAVVIRAFNRLHRLTRGTKSRTFEKMSDSDIAARMAREAGLAFGRSGPEANIKHDHIYQHNQTNLEFLRVRAARIGYEVLVDEATLYFRRSEDPVTVPIGCSGGAGGSSVEVRVFHPRLSSVKVVKKVIVRGWDPDKKEEIVGEATRRIIPLSPAAAAETDPPGSLLDLGVVLALSSEAVAYGAANGTLAALTALDVSAEADTDGSAWLRAGAGVALNQGSRFGGKYLVVGASHRFARGSADGWHTLLRLVRMDRGVYLLPEVGDEVLLAFEHGDIHFPYVVGSLWNDKNRIPEAPFCEKGAGGQ